MPQNNYDVIITGGGPAGSTAGYLLVKAGLKVLLIDKKKFPRHKLCAGCITDKTVRLISRVFEVAVSELKDRGIINFESGSYDIFYRNKPLLRSDMPAPFYFVDRYRYDDFFLRKAQQKGVEVLEGERVVSLDINNNEIQTESGAKFTASFIIGADGVNSLARRQFPADLFDQRTWRDNNATAMEILVDRSEITQTVDHPVLYFDYIDYGYSWMFPNKDKMVIGMCGLAQKNKKQFLPSFNKFLSDLGIKNAENYGMKGYTLPYGNFLLKPVFKSILLTGDAAGFADPLIGEGIFYAHRSAELASQAVCEFIGEDANENAQSKTGERYIQLLQQHVYTELIYAGKIRAFIFTYLKKFHYLPLKIVMTLFGNRPAEAMHGMRSYRWMRRLKRL